MNSLQEPHQIDGHNTIIGVPCSNPGKAFTEPLDHSAAYLVKI